MAFQPLQVEGRVRLRFSDAAEAIEAKDLSAACRAGPLLWLAGDEQSQVLRLTASADGNSYSGAHLFRLGDFVDLPEGRNREGEDAEVDVEGIDILDDYLWLVGSHSQTRGKVRPDDDTEKAVKKLSTVKPHPNRNMILRLPLEGDEDHRHPVPSSKADGAATRSAECYTNLLDALSSDQHLQAFLPVPGKDNGLDVEGLLALPDSLLLGLRGPVLRGWAVILEVSPSTSAEGGDRDSYQKFFLDLGGLGVRDLCRVDDVLILAGPTMSLDSPVRLYRWREAVTTRDTAVVRGEQIARVDLLRDKDAEDAEDAEDGHDHAEGITTLPGSDPAEVLVVYDTPSKTRSSDDGDMLAVVFALAPTA
jgi:hypothetical protein